MFWICENCLFCLDVEIVGQIYLQIHPFLLDFTILVDYSIHLSIVILNINYLNSTIINRITDWIRYPPYLLVKLGKLY
jgi:flagellar biosynthesis component FlhA